MLQCSSIVHKLKQFINNDRYRHLTEDRRKEIQETLENYKDGFVVVEDKENEIRKEINELVYDDEQSSDIQSFFEITGKEIKAAMGEKIRTGIIALDHKKQFGIMDAIEQRDGDGRGGS